MANETELTRTLPVLFVDQNDGTTAERVATVNVPDHGTFDTLAASGATSTLTLQAGDAVASVVLYGTWAGAVAFEVTMDGGTNWFPFYMAAGGSQSGAWTAWGSVTGQGNNWFKGTLPAGATHIRVRCTTYTSGTISVRSFASQRNNDPNVTVNPWVDRTSLANSLGALNANVSPTLQPGDCTVAFAITGTYSGTISFEVTFDLGANWLPLQMFTGSSASSPAVSTSATGVWFQTTIPSGTMAIRARMSSYTSGTATVVATVSQNPTSQVASIFGTANQTSTSRQGLMAAAGIWTDVSTTTLTGAASMATATAADLAGNASGSAFTSGSYGEEFRISAEADVVGTLYLEVSRDNTTFRRIRGVTLTQFDGTSGFYGEIIWRPSWRYARPAFVNGAGAQSRFQCQTYRLAL